MYGFTMEGDLGDQAYYAYLCEPDGTISKTRRFSFHESSGLAHAHEWLRENGAERIEDRSEAGPVADPKRDHKQQAETIDITPVGCHTPEGAKAVAEAMKAFEDSAAALANATMQFLDEYQWDLKAAITSSRESSDFTIAAIREDLHQLEALAGGRKRAQERFLAAVAGQTRD